MKHKYEQALVAYRKKKLEHDSLLYEFSNAFSKDVILNVDDASRFRLLNALINAVLSEYDNDGARAAVLSACDDDDEVVDAFWDAFKDSNGLLLRKRDWDQRGDGIRDVMARALRNLRNK